MPDKKIEILTERYVKTRNLKTNNQKKNNENCHWLAWRIKEEQEILYTRLQQFKKKTS